MLSDLQAGPCRTAELMRSWVSCDCESHHSPKRVVLTGGPGAGKSAILELIGHFFCHHVRVLPEAAGIVFGGGFPRETRPEGQRAAQRAIFHVQRELEATVAGEDAAIVLCDRGTIDGIAYWPGPDDFWRSVGATLDEELARYDMVVHLRTPRLAAAYNRDNPLRIETAAEAAVVDERIFQAWSRHPHRVVVEPTPDFLLKASKTIDVLHAQMPMCCEHHVASFPMTSIL